MNRSIPGIPVFARMRWLLCVGALGLGLVAPWSDATAIQVIVIGPAGVIDSATDDGDGEIRIEWSLSAAGENEVFVNPYPDEVCVRWGKTGGSTTDTCFTEGMSTQTDLLVDTGLGADEPATEYETVLYTYYNKAVRNPDDGFVTVTVTLNEDD